MMSDKKGKLIVFEGMSCSGKAAQIQLLKERLCSEGFRVRVFDFPNYSSPTGKVVRRYLDGEFGSVEDVPAKVASVFYANDRSACKDVIEDELSRGSVVILNRYVGSNMGYQGGKVRDSLKRVEFFEWVSELEYNNFGLPLPDLVLFLHVPYEIGLKLAKDRGVEFGLGRSESNFEYMKNVEESYLHLADLYGWEFVNCVLEVENKKLLSVEDIHEKVWNLVGGALKYSEDERFVLDYFFTNNSNSIFASKNFHPEVWALMQARYSRSQKGLRESFLDLLKEKEGNFEMLVEELRKSKKGEAVRYSSERAVAFMEKWVLGYGHSSVAEGAVVGLGLEGVSILATKVIEDNRLSSFCEKSTRYVSFNRRSFYLDEVLKNSEFALEIEDMLDYLFSVYIKLHEPVLEYVKGVSSFVEGGSRVAWERACAARRFDSIRYLLPTCTKTSLGWTVNARQLSYAISKFLSHPLGEVREIGEKLKIEGEKILPSLLRHTDKKDYFCKTVDKMQSFNFGENSFDGEKVRLVNFKENPEDMIIASIVYRFENCSFDDALSRVRKMSVSEKEKVLESYLCEMGDFDYPMREFEHESFSFDIVMDYGAFRDLQRHRICTQTSPIFSSDLGYDVPEDIVAAGVETEYRLAMEKACEVYNKVREKYPVEAQYLLPLGFRKRFLISMNLREICHFVKLRSTPMAHESYRGIARDIYKIMNLKFPMLAKYIICNYKEEKLGRLKAEEKTEGLVLK